MAMWSELLDEVVYISADVLNLSKVAKPNSKFVRTYPSAESRRSKCQQTTNNRKTNKEAENGSHSESSPRSQMVPPYGFPTL